jgi:hypothetical protein
VGAPYGACRGHAGAPERASAAAPRRGPSAFRLRAFVIVRRLGLVIADIPDPSFKGPRVYSVIADSPLRP